MIKKNMITKKERTMIIAFLILSRKYSYSKNQKILIEKIYKRLKLRANFLDKSEILFINKLIQDINILEKISKKRMVEKSIRLAKIRQAKINKRMYINSSLLKMSSLILFLFILKG